MNHTFKGMIAHLVEDFGYSVETVNEMTDTEVIETFEKEIEELYSYYKKEGKVE